MLASSQTIVLVISIIGISIVLSVLTIVRCYKMPSQGQALIRSGFNGKFVSFNGKVVIPIVHKLEWLDITLKRIAVDRMGGYALTCQDGVQVDIKAAFFVRVSPTQEDVLKVAEKLGVEGAADVDKLSALFVPRFLETLQTVANVNTFEKLSDREYFKKQVIQIAGNDLDGYILDTVTIDYLDKTQTA